MPLVGGLQLRIANVIEEGKYGGPQVRMVSGRGSSEEFTYSNCSSLKKF